MADTGWLSPTATGQTYNDWTDPANAYSSNDVYAGGGAGKYQDYYNFNFGVPAGATINGIQVQIEGHVPEGAGVTGCNFILSWDGGTSWTSGGFGSRTVSFTSESDETLSTGSSTVLWGRTWSVSEFTNANFRILAYIFNLTSGLSVDLLQVKVYYTAAATTTSTSTSTSSTSTSSTSTSSTSTSTSTSSTSTSTSSTSTSSTSTSTSTSSTLTSTSTSSTSTSSTSTSTSSTSTTVTTTSTSTSTSSSTSTSTSSSTSSSTSTTLPYEFSNVRELYFGDITGSIFRYGENYNDNGEGIPLEIVTAEYYPAGAEKTKDFHQVFAYANRNSGMSLYYRVIDTSGVIMSWKYLGRLKKEVNDFNFHYGENRGKGVQFRVLASGTGVPSVFRGLTLEYSVEGVRD